MNRRTFLIAAGSPLVATIVPRRLLAAQSGGGVVALVTADLEAHLVAVEIATGRVVERIPVSPGPRSIESNPSGFAVVAHTGHGRISIVDAATLSVLGEIEGFGEPRYTAMHPLERLAYVSDSSRDEVVTVDLVRQTVVHRTPVPGPARHITASSDGQRLWTALGTKARTVAVLELADSRRPRLARTIAPPFLAHDVVFAPGDEQVWVTSGSTRAIAVYPVAGREPAVMLRADAAPQHVAFSESHAYVASGDSGTMRVHRLDGSFVRTSPIPAGSYNVTYGAAGSTLGRPVAVTPSLELGTVCVLAPNGSVRRIRKIARSAHDACIVEAG